MSRSTAVIVPVRDGAQFIAEGLASVLPQLGPQDSVVVVDDASTDATADIVRAIVASDRRVRLLPCDGTGCAAGRNTGLRHSDSEFVAFLDYDDLWPQGSFRRLKDALLARPDVLAVYGRMQVRFEAGVDSRYARMDGQYVIRVGVWGCLFRREGLARIDGFDESLRAGEDSDYWLRLEEAGFASAPVDAVTIVYRRHAGNMTLDLALKAEGSLEMLRRRLARHRRANS